MPGTLFTVRACEALTSIHTTKLKKNLKKFKKKEKDDYFKVIQNAFEEGVKAWKRTNSRMKPCVMKLEYEVLERFIIYNTST
jgi:hypothetical protein